MRMKKGTRNLTRLRGLNLKKSEFEKIEFETEIIEEELKHSVVTSVGQRKKSESPTGIEPMTFLYIGWVL